MQILNGHVNAGWENSRRGGTGVESAGGGIFFFLGGGGIKRVEWEILQNEESRERGEGEGSTNGRLFRLGHKENMRCDANVYCMKFSGYIGKSIVKKKKKRAREKKGQEDERGMQQYTRVLPPLFFIRR